MKLCLLLRQRVPDAADRAGTRRLQGCLVHELADSAIIPTRYLVDTLIRTCARCAKAPAGTAQVHRGPGGEQHYRDARLWTPQSSRALPLRTASQTCVTTTTKAPDSFGVQLRAWPVSPGSARLPKTSPRPCLQVAPLAWPLSWQRPIRRPVRSFKTIRSGGVEGADGPVPRRPAWRRCLQLASFQAVRSAALARLCRPPAKDCHYVTHAVGDKGTVPLRECRLHAPCALCAPLVAPCMLPGF